MFEYLFERFGDENVLNSHENNFTMQKKKNNFKCSLYSC